MSDEIDWIARAGAKAKGRRPRYFDQPAQDRMLSMLMALIGEVSVLRERLDTVERLLEAKGSLDRADIESFAPDKEAARERGILTRDYIHRVMRAVQQDMEAMAALPDPPIDQLAKTLREM